MRQQLLPNELDCRAFSLWFVPFVSLPAACAPKPSHGLSAVGAWLTTLFFAVVEPNPTGLIMMRCSYFLLLLLAIREMFPSNVSVCQPLQVGSHWKILRVATHGCSQRTRKLWPSSSIGLQPRCLIREEESRSAERADSLC